MVYHKHAHLCHRKLIDHKTTKYMCQHYSRNMESLFSFPVLFMPHHSKKQCVMYAKCGFLSTTHEIFDDRLVKDANSWNILTAGYVEHGYSDTTLYLLEQMQRMGIHPNNVTLVCSLKACGSIRATLAGNEICEEIVQKVVERDYFIGNTLVDMYAKCTNCRIC